MPDKISLVPKPLEAEVGHVVLVQAPTSVSRKCFATDVADEHCTQLFTLLAAVEVVIGLVP